MPRIKLTKGEFKKQRDALKQYERYLPTLQLKKQQLQLEILRQLNIFAEKKHSQDQERKLIISWIGLLEDPVISIKPYLIINKITTGLKNIAGVDIPIYENIEFPPAEYDLFMAPLWVDAAIDALRAYVSVEAQLSVIERGLALLKYELRITTQRVNLFEKVKIPEAKENIRLIKIYIGDQLSNAVGRCKIAKRKIEELELEGVGV
ncbi:MAG: V-type ATP synthase subunit D [Candidatus Omnitrophica bacterium CG08_land_8_20_14_0_20_41_16]|uniref:V-type ATP synthase subunit D n=1 Tax=Candidatus Sherwoodlollariibacterium unditelluris TaxID=1974757 RepID=A0A2G9YHJ8_9BACT|nr:MAG: V-type ATP synthase subunit D [Candidatus Omnitrophica bacterium CG23_combo_of_CG06-09_8_20_14_all_41_10]PIS34148.1 MAG: V-type ATP synthase subunit D [Candidatus Omnitrophica bacterium CG08_land_8_20_14_0_20_41_16]